MQIREATQVLMSAIRLLSLLKKLLILCCIAQIMKLQTIFFLCAHQRLIEIVGRTPAIIEISAFYHLFEKLVNEIDSGFALAGQLAT